MFLKGLCADQIYKVQTDKQHVIAQRNLWIRQLHLLTVGLAQSKMDSGNRKCASLLHS